jgi:peptidoglycan-associated lipoprotein
MPKKSLSVLCLVFVLCFGIALVGCPKKVIKTDEGAVTGQEDAAAQAKAAEERARAKAEQERAARAAEEARIKQDEMRRAAEGKSADAKSADARSGDARSGDAKSADARKTEEERRKAAEERKKFEESLTQRRQPGIEGEVIDSKLLKDVHFDFDKYDVRPADGDILKENASILLKNPNLKIQIEGHCDERGTAEYNLALGERRANSIKKQLVSLGVPAERLSVISYGKEMPLDPGHNEEAWAKNRRGHLTILSK